jgi:uncharacterized membrane protein
MKDLIIWLVHFPAGMTALVAVLSAFYYPKGTAPHRQTGKVFTIAMLVMLVSGGIAAVLKDSADDVLLAAFVFYTVFTAWLTVHRRPGESGLLERLALIYILGLGLGAAFVNPEWDTVRDPNFYITMPVLATLFALGDLHNLRTKGLRDVPRLARHVWRYGFSLIWAALAFGDKLIKMWDSTIKEMPYVLIGPGVLVMCVTLYWLYRIYVGIPQVTTNVEYRP